MKYICPICNYPDLDEEPYCSYEICPRCWFEPGYEDGGAGLEKDSEEREKKLQELRIKWLENGRLCWGWG